MKRFNLSEGELNCMIIFERIKTKELTQEEAAVLLKISLRQLIRKKNRYELEGPNGLKHKGWGKPSNRATDTGVVAEIMKLMESKYLLLKEKAGPTFLADQFAKHDGITIDHETLRRLMISKGLWEVTNRKQRRHQWRERKHHIGELVQIDGSLHIWFGDEYSTLIAFIDDATGRFQIGEFVNRESTEDLGRLTHDYVKKYGRPIGLYSDRGGVYKVNNKDARSHKTQFQRMLQELDIELIHARSPQAKGRIERLFKTVQDRLVKELQLAGITTREAANEYLKNIYIPEHNKKFAFEPQKKADFHRPIDAYNLHHIFCLKFERTINNDYTINFKNQWLQLERNQPVMIRRGQAVVVHENFDGTIDLFRSGKRLEFKRISKLTKQQPKKKEIKYRQDVKLVAHKPSKSHPWRSFDIRSGGDIFNEFKR